MTIKVKDKNTYGEEIKIQKDVFKLNAFVSPFNKRVRLIDYNGSNVEKVADQLGELARSHDFATKVFAKVRMRDLDIFKERGFRKEAVIKGYYNGYDAAIVADYFDESRKITPEQIQKKEQEIEKRLEDLEIFYPDNRILPDGYTIKQPETDKEFNELAELYREVFKSYPFPILEPQYLKKTAKTHVIYAIIYDNNNQLVASASAETDPDHNNSEMTDFATLPSQRGKGLATALLKYLEKEVSERGITNLYSIARSRSFGMNYVLKKAGYERTGKLINNCYICNDFENMTVWCKTL